MYLLKTLLICACVAGLNSKRALRGDSAHRRDYRQGLRNNLRARKNFQPEFNEQEEKAHQEDERSERSLLNTFPFNRQNVADDANHAHQHHRLHQDVESQYGPSVAAEQLDPRDSRQRGRPTPSSDAGAVSFNEVAAVRPGSDGRRCIDKVEMIEETEYDEVVQCDHSYDRRCHTTYVTSYESQQEEKCEENYRKSCYIEYDTIAFNQTVQVCRTPLVKDCDIQGPEICSTQYESECWTKNEEHDVTDDVVECETVKEEKCENVVSGYTSEQKCSVWPKEVCNVRQKQVKKYTPITACTKEPKEVCAPAGCGFKEGNEKCFDKTQTVVQDAPKEECSLEPQRTCAHVTKLVPKLEPTEECVDVPKEVCTRSKSNPRKVKRPVVKKWCYNPTEESGLA